MYLMTSDKVKWIREGRSIVIAVISGTVAEKLR